MLKKKNVALHLSALGVLLAEFLLVRYALIDLHGMYQWPVVLLGIGMIFLAISFFKQGRVLPLVTAGSYLVSFFLGVIRQTDGSDPGGGRTNTLWIIWTCAMIALVALGFVFERILREKKG